MPPGVWISIALVWALTVGLAALLTRSPRRGDIPFGIAYWSARAVARLVHRLRIEGAANIPAPSRGLIVVANHTAGLDPVIVQCAVPVLVRWMMAADMMLPVLRGLWEMVDVIPVAGDGKELASARAAIRAVERGETVGIFPEGAIERPPRVLRPFIPGVGLIIAKTRAPVLPIVIDGTPYADTAWGSLLKPSRSRVRVMPVIEYAGRGMRADEIAADLERRYQEWTGWPIARPGAAG